MHVVELVGFGEVVAAALTAHAPPSSGGVLLRRGPPANRTQSLACPTVMGFSHKRRTDLNLRKRHPWLMSCSRRGLLSNL